jgi:glycogen debranching enzyme
MMNSKIGRFICAFHNEEALAVAIPKGKIAGIRLRMRAEKGQISQSGGQIHGLRTLTYDSESPAIMNDIRNDAGLFELNYLLEASSEHAIRLSFEPHPSLSSKFPPFFNILQAAETRWHSWFSQAPPVSASRRAKYLYAWWVIANNLVSPMGMLKYEAMMPSKSFYIGAWNWDAAFHAVAIRHLDPQLARDQLRTVIHHQLKDGMMPDAIYDEGIVKALDHPIPGRVTKPPVLAWAALKIHQLDPDLDFLLEIYAPLARWNSWWMSENIDATTGLAEYRHPYSSGLDDSPLWDHGMPAVSPDLNTYLSIQTEALGMMAELLGMRSEASNWRERSSEIVHRMAHHLYDSDQGYFMAMHNGRPIPELTPLNLMPLWTGRLPTEIQNSLIGHLADELKFWGRFPLSTVSKASSSYDPNTMWRGPVWVNVNYMFVEALLKVGRRDLAAELRDRTLELLSDSPGLFEYYNSETGSPATRAVPMFGWTAALFIDLVIQAENRL